MVLATSMIAGMRLWVAQKYHLSRKDSALSAGWVKRSWKARRIIRHDRVVERFAADGPDEALGVAVHLRGANSGLDGTDAEIPDSAGELVSICPVAISDHESGCRVPGEGIDRLLAEPEGRRTCRHVREDKAAAFEGQNHENVKDLESDRGHGEHRS